MYLKVATRHYTNESRYLINLKLYQIVSEKVDACKLHNMIYFSIT